MREILFRGKRIDTKEWAYGHHFEGFTGISYILVLHDHILGMTEFYEVISETIGQYTGLTDKNGNKIFEGDIVKSITHFYGESKERVTVVKFNEVENDSFGKPFTVGYSLLGSEWEIIGNIHDNPELLK